MLAREVFCAARDGIVRMRDYEFRELAKRELCAMRARNYEPHGRGGVTDPTKRIDDLIDFEAKHAKQAAEDGRMVRLALRMLGDYARIDPDGAAVLRARYIDLMPWKDIAEAAGTDYDGCRQIESVALDRMDSEGMANIAAGTLDVTGAL